MRNRRPFYCRGLFGLLIFLIALSFGPRMGNGQALSGEEGLKGIRDGKAGLLAQKIRKAVEIHKRHTGRLMDIFGVVGTGTGLGPDGLPVIRVFASRAGISGIPSILEGVQVNTEVTGRFYAFADPPSDPTERWDRPVPIGVSTGHPLMTAGTIGCRVTDDAGVYALSNNHVYANINNASIGDGLLQPGDFDGGQLPQDFIGTLADYEPLAFCTVMWIWLFCPQTNTIDAAIADVVDPGTGQPLVDTATPSDGYGIPNSTIHPAYGVPEVIGDENLSLLIGQSVQKYGRTTRLTVGTINTINSTVDVCYDDACQLIARFTDQITVIPGTFSDGGDSGSLIVSNDAEKHPVGLLYAGSASQTIANRIDLVLNRFGVSIDSGTTEPYTDIAISDVSAPAAVVQGDMVSVDVTVENVGNLNAGAFDVSLRDTTDGVGIGTAQNVSGLPVGGSTILTFSWDTTGASVGDHTLEASHNLADDYELNNAAATVVAVADTLTDIAVTGVSAPAAVVQGDMVSVDVTVENVGNQDVDAFEITLTDATDSVLIDSQILQSPLAAGNSTIVPFSWDTGGATIGDHALSATHNLTTDENPNNDTNGVDVEVMLEPVAGPQLRTGKAIAHTDQWTTITLDRAYNDMIVVCTPNYDISSTAPVIVAVDNAFDDHFDIKLVPAVWGLTAFEPPWSAEVHWMVVEAGVYNTLDHGVKMEAVKFTSTVTDQAGSWVGQSRSYAQTYTQPVVVGQVMTYHADHDFYWSTFWSRGSNKNKPPSSSSLWVGKHKGEDPRAVYNETIGYIIIEAGTGSIEGTDYTAGLGSDSISGVGNSPPYTYALSGLSSPTTAIVSQAAMDGANGGWAILYGTNPLTASALRLAIEEDWALDSERNHTTEQVEYIVFE